MKSDDFKAMRLKRARNIAAVAVGAAMASQDIHDATDINEGMIMVANHLYSKVAQQKPVTDSVLLAIALTEARQSFTAFTASKWKVEVSA